MCKALNETKKDASPMTKTTQLFPLILALAASAPASARDAECAAKVGKQTICEFATQLAGTLSQQMPSQNGQVTLESARASKHIVYVAGRLAFDQKSASDFFKEKNITLGQFEDTYSRQMTPMLCSPGSPTQKFISAGGAILYAYAYKDGKPFMKFGVRNCRAS